MSAILCRMHKERLWLGAGLAVVLAVAGCGDGGSTGTNTAPAAGVGGSQTASRPNIVFVLTDDQRWDAISLSGHETPATPNIDRIGREGVYFRNAFATTALCSPSRASTTRRTTTR